jgi:hypothetical protein
MFCLGNLPADNFPLLKQSFIVLFPIHAFSFFILPIYYRKKGNVVNNDNQLFTFLYALRKIWLLAPGYTHSRSMLNKLSYLEPGRCVPLRKRMSKYNLPTWVQNIKSICGQFIIPFCVFQGIRTILLPTTFDVLLLAFLILIALALYFNII